MANWFGFPGELPPPLALQQLIVGKWVSQAVAVAAELGVADRIAAGESSAAALAAALEVNEDALYRLLRALANVGVLEEQDGRRFALTPVGAFLRSDVPGSLRGWAQMAGHEGWWRPWGELRHSIATGEPASPLVHGRPIFDYIDMHPDAAQVFNASMTSISGLEAEAVAAAFDASGIGTLADVGGGHGFLLATILRRHPELRGVLFDLPPVVAGAEAALREQGVADRCRVVGGSFFDRGPEGVDAIVLKHVLHDWDDPACERILRNCHAALPPRGRLVIVEMVVPPAGENHFAKLLDLEMLVITDRGRERTAEEFRSLVAAAGFELVGIVPTPSPVSLVETRRA